MIHFMVDFENVRNNGLKGCEYLDPYDNITIFYSACCSGIEQVRMEQILSIECGFDVCKLNKTGKNALDFYVASRIGQEFGSGYKGDIAIVSNDTGFSAVQDYWHLEKRHIILGTSVEKCIVSAEKKSFRTSIICKNNTLISIERMHERYQEKQRIRKELKELFNGSHQ